MLLPAESVDTDALPYASTLCGACFDACPVRIDIPNILVHLRARQVDSERHGLPGPQDIAMKAAGWAMRSDKRFSLAEAAAKAARLVRGKNDRITWLPFPASKWTSSRDMVIPPKETFRQWWARTPSEDR